MIQILIDSLAVLGAITLLAVVGVVFYFRFTFHDPDE